MSELRERIKHENGKATGVKPVADPANIEHPSGPPTTGIFGQVCRAFAFFLFFTASIVVIAFTQFLGAPLYYINQDYYYGYMAFTKKQFGLVTNCITEWFCPPLIRVSGDASVKGQIRLDHNGNLRTKFSERMIMIANHQIYTDWLYLWWVAYTGDYHGHIFIILKQSLKFIPIIGPGMMFFGFIFMARNWKTDKPRMQYRLQKLNTRHSGPNSGPNELDPMWLLIFPEGTNLSKNGRKASQKWAEKQGIPDLKHQLLPRSRGLQFCLQGLKDSVEWVYDCTIAYEGIPHGAYGQDIFTLKSSYFQGRAPPSVNMYWRRFAVKDIPFEDSEAFDKWVAQRWLEKDEFIEQYLQTGRLPRDESGAADGSGYIETQVRGRSRFDVLLIFVGLIPLFPIGYAIRAMYKSVFG